MSAYGTGTHAVYEKVGKQILGRTSVDYTAAADDKYLIRDLKYTLLVGDDDLRLFFVFSVVFVGFFSCSLLY